MAKMHKILEGIKVDDILKELSEHPGLWNQYTFRTNYDSSPHRDVDDIWLRYRDYSELDPDHPENFSDQHTSVWYASAFHLPSVKDTIEKIFTVVDGDELGGCLITRIPAGKSVMPHSDSGWHVNHYLNKYLLLLQSAPGQSFNFGEEKHEGNAGDLFIFDNRAEHEVINASDTDRISLIIAIKPKEDNE